MAKGRYITDFERDVIRVGYARRIPITLIARFLGRSRRAVEVHARQMREAGTLGNLPFPFVADDLGEGMQDGQ